MAVAKGPTLQQRAIVQLITLATEGRTTTYEDLALALGTPSSGNALGGTLGPILGDVFHWCVRTSMPMLTSLVVRKSGSDEGMPGRGFWELAQTLEGASRFKFYPEGQLVDAPRKVRRVYTDLQHLQCYTFFQPLTQMDLSKSLPSVATMAEVIAEEPVLDNIKTMRQVMAHRQDNKRRVDSTEFNVIIVGNMTTYGDVNEFFPPALYDKYESDQVTMDNTTLRLNTGGEKRKGVVIVLRVGGAHWLLSNLINYVEVMGGWDNLDSIVALAGFGHGKSKVLFDRYKGVQHFPTAEMVIDYRSQLSDAVNRELQNVPDHVWGAALLLK